MILKHVATIANWVKNNPILASLLVFIAVQTIINAILFTGIIQTQNALRALMIKLSPPIQTWHT